MPQHLPGFDVNLKIGDFLTLHSFWANSSNRPIDVTLCSIHWHGAGEYPQLIGPTQVRMPKASGSAEGRELYPLDTNLLKTPVAGLAGFGFVGQDSAVKM